MRTPPEEQADYPKLAHDVMRIETALAGPSPAPEGAPEHVREFWLSASPMQRYVILHFYGVGRDAALVRAIKHTSPVKWRELLFASFPPCPVRDTLDGKRDYWNNNK